VAFASNRSGAWELYVVDIDGGNLRQVTRGGGQNLHPSWSPDGRRLVYCCRSDRTGVWEIYLTDLAAPNSRKYLGEGIFPVFSPTENRIAYQRSRGPGSRLFGIWTMDVSGERPGLPTLVISSPRMAYVSPSFSSDGAELAFTALSPTRPDADGDIMVVSVEGENLHRLTAGPGQKFGPVWAMDRVYFSSSRDGTENIWSVLTGSPLLAEESAPAMTNRAVGEPEIVDLAQSPSN
jgi:Tol biopolymer transport system component